VNHYKSTIISIITIIKIIPARCATPCDTKVQVRQAAQPSERRRQGRRGSGTAGRPAARATPPGLTHCGGQGCCACGGEGRLLSQVAGAWGKRRSAGGREEGWTWRSREYPLPPWHRAHPHFPSAWHPAHQAPPPPACSQGAIPELKPLGLGEGREGPCEARGALWADAVIPAGGAWGKPRSGQAWPLGASLAGKSYRERCKETPKQHSRVGSSTAAPSTSEC
jgi:hypothetical protein